MSLKLFCLDKRRLCCFGSGLTCKNQVVWRVWAVRSSSCLKGRCVGVEVAKGWATPLAKSDWLHQVLRKTIDSPRWVCRPENEAMSSTKGPNFKRKASSSKHYFSEDMLVSGRVYLYRKYMRNFTYDMVSFGMITSLFCTWSQLVSFWGGIVFRASWTIFDPSLLHIGLQILWLWPK